MPLYYFHVRGASGDTEADEGLEYPDEDAARAAALAGARGIIAADVLDGTLDLSSRIDVCDQAGRLLFTVPFDSAVNRRQAA